MADAAPDSEFPKMLYRKGSEIEHHGYSLDTVTVESAAEETAARKEGYADLAKAIKAKAE